MSDTTDVTSDVSNTDASAPEENAGTSRRRRAAGNGLTAMLLPELQSMASSLGISGTARLRKGELIAAIQEQQSGEGRVPGPRNISADAPDRRTVARAEASRNEVRTEVREDADRADTDRAPARAERDAERAERPERGVTDQRNGDQRNGGEQRVEREQRGDREPTNRRERTDNRGNDRSDRSDNRGDGQREGQRNDSRGSDQRNDQRGDQRNDQRGDQRGGNNPNNNSDDDDEGGRRGRRSRFRDRNRRGGTRERGDEGQHRAASGATTRRSTRMMCSYRSPASSTSSTTTRSSGRRATWPAPNDVYVSMAQIKRYGLRRGDAVTGAVRALPGTNADGSRVGTSTTRWCGWTRSTGWIRRRRGAGRSSTS